MKMKPKNSTPIRAPGQRSIPSTLLFRQSHNCSDSSKVDSNSGRSNVSLSAFLNRKLHSTPVLPIEKENVSNSSEVKSVRVLLSADREEQKPVIGDSVFRLFNGAQGVKATNRSSVGSTDDARAKRRVYAKDSCSNNKKPMCLDNHRLARSHHDLENQTQNHLVVLGDDPRPKRRTYANNSCSNKKPRPLYNHYENGTGWWDSEREGIDNDEVGSSDIWEGMGSTTIGGLDWH